MLFQFSKEAAKNIMFIYKYELYAVNTMIGF